MSFILNAVLLFGNILIYLATTVRHHGRSKGLYWRRILYL